MLQGTSEFCKSDLGFHSVKSKEFITKFFRDTDTLTDVIKEYHQRSKIPKGEYICSTF